MPYKSVWCLGAAVAALAACQTAPVADSAAPAAQDGVELSIVQEDGPEDSSCKVKFRVTYPTDIPAHKRELVVTQGDRTITSGAAQYPRPERDHRQVNHPDGTSTFEFGKWTFSPCRDTIYDEPVTYDIRIGDCVEGPCPPMTYVDNGTAPDIKVNLAE